MTIAPALDAASLRARTIGRWAVVDVVRGAAIVAVVIYHFIWDLAHFGLAGSWTSTPAGRMTGHVIAGTFLFLTGFSLVLAQRSSFDARGFGRRLGKLLLCAYAITAVSAVIAPSMLVTFGILHDIALTSVLLLPFLWADRLVALGAALVAFAATSIVTIDSTSRWLTWTGLTPKLSPGLDVQPLLPLFGVSLLGLVAARVVIEHPGLVQRVASWRPRPAATVVQTWGRHTLAIYLAHQPVLFAVLGAATLLRRG